jgi:hypothetical protein
MSADRPVNDVIVAFDFAGFGQKTTAFVALS